MNIRRFLTATLTSAVLAVGLVAGSASTASAAVGSWTPESPGCTNPASSESDLIYDRMFGRRFCSTGGTFLFRGTSESPTVYLDVTRVHYRLQNNAWSKQSTETTRYRARCNPQYNFVVGGDWSNGDCDEPTQWHSAEQHCYEVYTIGECSDIWLNAKTQFEVPAGTAVALYKTAWFVNQGRWEPQTVRYWIDDKGAVTRY